MPANLKAVLFDMDGVIVDNNDYHRKAWQLFLKRHGMDISDEEYNRRISGRVNSELVAMLFGTHLNQAEVKRLGEEKEQIFRDLYEHHLRPISGLHDFIKLLRKAGIRLAVGTSAPVSNLDFILDGLGVRDSFDVLVHQGMIERGKPDPEIYQTCMEQLGVQPGESLVFEDSLAGIQSGLAAGARVVGVTTTHSAGELKGTLCNIEHYRDGQLESVFPEILVDDQ
ncbi:MAG: HAD family hydrolase [Endozoicomonas sp.]|uniref:HAD family hydrolase n=1 Tax=Endozoicomonas sp. TaxID=1892382 RepID=UPI003D9BAD3F